MKHLKLCDVIKEIGGELLSGSDDIIVKYATIRPSMMRNNAIFFDLDNARYFYPSDFKEYKSSVIVSEKPENFEVLRENAVIVKVKNVKEAYHCFTKYYRRLFPIPIIGITGTCGKTTTKEMIKHILSEKYVVRSTYKSQNAGYLDLHYLVGIDEKTQYGVIEMGVLWPGDLIESNQVLQPQIRIILNIGVYHLTGCKTPDAYIKAKGEMLSGIDEVNGTLILNKDDENIKKIDISSASKVVYFGLSNGCDFQARKIKYVDNKMLFTLKHEGYEYKVSIPGLGRHNVYNALAAIATVHSTGVNIKQAINRLESFEPVIEHMEIHKGFNECKVIDDSWSSAPPSVISALDALKYISKFKRKIALLGIMPLLGESEYAVEEYRKIGEKVMETRVDLLVVAGEEAREIGIRAIELGMNKNKVFFCNTGDEIFNIIQKYLNKHTVVLLKITHRQMVETSFIKMKSMLMDQNTKPVKTNIIKTILRGKLK